MQNPILSTTKKFELAQNEFIQGVEAVEAVNEVTNPNTSGRIGYMYPRELNMCLAGRIDNSKTDHVNAPTNVGFREGRSYRKSMSESPFMSWLTRAIFEGISRIYN